jgi:hypothetical protein
MATWPGTPRKPFRPGYWLGLTGTGLVPGEYRKFGVIRLPSTDNPLHPGEGHARYKRTDYYNRRVKRVFKLREYPKLPTLPPTGPQAYKHYYPWYRYPSGQLNPNWWRGVDDDGNPPPPH